MKIIIKYQNRKLYDRENSKYINLSELVKLPLGSFQVLEHKTNKNVTLDTLLSFVGNVGESNDKVKVMQHCINLLSA